MKIVFSLILLVLAVVMDIHKRKISNRLILTGLMAGLIFQMAESGWKGAGVFFINVSIPIILCYLLFLMRALGAGDIKLFSVIGSIWNLEILFVTIIASFVTAAGMSLCKLLYHRNLISRLCVFGKYICQVAAEGRVFHYPVKSQDKQNIIHFSIAILIGYIIALEVAY